MKDSTLGPGRFVLPSKRRVWKYIPVADRYKDDPRERKKNKIAVERLQLPLSPARVLTANGLQGRTVNGILLDLKRPPGMTKDEHWFALVVLLSRAPTFKHMLFYRLPTLPHLNDGPPEYLTKEMRRLAELAVGTAKRLDQVLKALQLEKLRQEVTSKAIVRAVSFLEKWPLQTEDPKGNTNGRLSLAVRKPIKKTPDPPTTPTKRRISLPRKNSPQKILKRESKASPASQPSRVTAQTPPPKRPTQGNTKRPASNSATSAKKARDSGAATASFCRPGLAERQLAFRVNNSQRAESLKAQDLDF